MSSRHVLVLSIVLAGVSTCIGFLVEAPTEPYAWTRYRFSQLRMAIRDYVDERGTLPDSIADICPPMVGGEVCDWWPMAQRVVDEWNHPFAYRRVADEYELRSAGPDGQLETPDDLVYRPSTERRMVELMAGCYRVSFEHWTEYPSASLLRLDTLETSIGQYAAAPSLAGYTFEPWWIPIDQSTAEVTWLTYHHSAVLRLRRLEGSVEATLSGGGGAASPGIGRPPRGERVAAEQVLCHETR